MKQLFNTRLRVILVLAVLVTAGLSVMSGLTNKSVPDLVVQGVLAPFRSIATSLTRVLNSLEPVSILLMSPILC